MVLFLGRTTYPGSSHERVLPVATRPHTEYRLTPPLTLSGEGLFFLHTFLPASQRLAVPVQAQTRPTAYYIT